MESADDATLMAIDEVLGSLADRIDRTRKGRNWDLWIEERPFHVQVVDSPASITLAAGCNRAEDYGILRRLTKRIADAVGGVSSRPAK